MGTILECDTCGAKSPDENGLYQANHWHEITYQDRIRKHAYFKTSETWLICGGCFGNLTLWLNKEREMVANQHSIGGDNEG